MFSRDMGYGNSLLYLRLRYGCVTNGSPGPQIQLFVDPFHRMFSLDNRSIQYPFAVVERVPVGEHARI
jgi:diacylglycerol diphosphate phosphatase/phosphatidate phosphatase